MFQIRPEVAHNFREKAVGESRGKIVSALQADLPDVTAAYSDAQMHAVVDYGMERGDWYGFHSEHSVYMFSAALLLYGGDFDVNPKYTWTRELLDDTEMDEDVKVKVLEMRISADTGRIL